MFRSRRRAAIRRAASSALRNSAYAFESLEQRVLLTATGDPVLVFTGHRRGTSLISLRGRN